MRMDASSVSEAPVVSAGNLGLDIALGVGGYPRGRIVEIYGPEASGKTTMALCAIAEVQKAGGIAAFIDAEHAFDRNNARILGVQVEDLLVSARLRRTGFGDCGTVGASWKTGRCCG